MADHSNVNTSHIKAPNAVHIGKAEQVNVYVNTFPHDDDISFNYNLRRYFEYMDNFPSNYKEGMALDYVDDDYQGSKKKSTKSSQTHTELSTPCTKSKDKWEKYISKVTKLVVEDFPDMCLIEKTNVYRKYVSNTSDSTVELEFRFKGVPHMTKCEVVYRENGEIVFHKSTKNPKKLYNAMKDFIFE